MTKGRSNVWTCVHKVLTCRWTAASFRRKRFKSGGARRWSRLCLIHWLQEIWWLSVVREVCARLHCLSFWLKDEVKSWLNASLCTTGPAALFHLLRKRFTWEKEDSRHFSIFVAAHKMDVAHCCVLLISQFEERLFLLSTGKKTHRFYSLAILWMITFCKTGSFSFVFTRWLNQIRSAVYNTEQFNFYSIYWLVSPLNSGMIQLVCNYPFNWAFGFLTTEHILFSHCQKRQNRKRNNQVAHEDKMKELLARYLSRCSSTKAQYLVTARGR